MPDNKPPAFQLYASDFLIGSAPMTNEEAGMFIRLLCYQWEYGGVPVNQVDKLCYGSVITELLQSKFKIVDGVMKNDRLERVRLQQQQYSKSKSKAGKAGMAKRWGDNRAKGLLLTKDNSSSSTSSSKKKIIKEPEYTEIFEFFWKASQRKGNKEKAFSAWNHRLETHSLDEIKSAFNVLKTDKADSERKFWPDATTFLNSHFDGYLERSKDLEPISDAERIFGTQIRNFPL